jgi:hypothetical protein
MFIQVSIGRNDSNGRMDDDHWDHFQQDVKDVIITSIYAPHPNLPALSLEPKIETHYGEGEWEGVKEESAHLSLYFPTPAGVAAHRVREMMDQDLSRLAYDYDQDAIAYVVATEGEHGLATR